MTGLPEKRLYVKFISLISGTTDLYFSTGALLTKPSNTYEGYLDLTEQGRGEQRVNPIMGSTQFPGYTFELTDARPEPGGTFVHASLGQVATLMYQNKAYIDGCRVIVYEGDDSTAYGSFTQVFDGHVFKWLRAEDGGAFQFELMPAIKKLERPIDFPTGSFQLGAAINSTTTKSIYVKDGVNVNPGTRTNLLGGSTAWTVTAGSFTGSPGIVLTNTAGGASTAYTDVAVGTGASDVKYGTAFTVYGSYGVGNTNNTFQVTIQAYNGAALLETVIGQVDTAGVGTDVFGVSYLITNQATTKLRITFTSDDTASPGAITTLYLVVAKLWKVGREMVDIIAYDTSSTNVLVRFAGRGALGSLPTAHDEDEEAIRITPIGGHPLDIFQRMVLTSSAAGTNGVYDPGDGYGLGNEITTAWLDQAVFNSERDATDAGSAFSGYNFANYRMLFFFSQKIPNFLEFAFEEIFKPIHGNLMIWTNGKMYPHLWRSSETVGASAFTDSNIVIPDGVVELVPEYDSENAVNRIVFRADEDPLSMVDIKGNQTQRNNFAREWAFNEVSFGEDSTTASSKARLGVRELVIESRGIRGAHSRRFGYTDNLNGDQMMFEVARRIATRHRWPIPCIREFGATFSARNFEVGEIASLTFANMIDVKAGAWGRTAAKAVIEGKVGPTYGDEEQQAMFGVRLIQDVDAIPNTSVDAAPTAPVDADITSVRKRISITEEEKDNLPIYPKGSANVVFVTMAATKTYERLVYVAVDGTAGAAYPGDSYLQCVGEIPAGETLFYFLAIGNSAGTTEAYVKVSARSADRAESAKNGTAQRAQYWTGAAWANGVNAGFAHGLNRGPKAEINQIANGERATVLTAPYNR